MPSEKRTITEDDNQAVTDVWEYYHTHCTNKDTPSTFREAVERLIAAKIRADNLIVGLGACLFYAAEQVGKKTV